MMLSGHVGPATACARTPPDGAENRESGYGLVAGGRPARLLRTAGVHANSPASLRPALPSPGRRPFSPQDSQPAASLSRAGLRAGDASEGTSTERSGVVSASPVQVRIALEAMHARLMAHAGQAQRPRPPEIERALLDCRIALMAPSLGGACPDTCAIYSTTGRPEDALGVLVMASPRLPDLQTRLRFMFTMPGEGWAQVNAALVAAAVDASRPASYHPGTLLPGTPERR